MRVYGLVEELIELEAPLLGDDSNNGLGLGPEQSLLQRHVLVLGSKGLLRHCLVSERALVKKKKPLSRGSIGLHFLKKPTEAILLSG